MNIRFAVPGDAVSFGTKATVFRRGQTMIRGTRKTTAAADWQAEVRRAAAEAMGGSSMFDGPVVVVIWCRFALPASRYLKSRRRPPEYKKTKPDGDKIDRLVIDAMEGVVYPHDAQVAAHALVKSTGEQGEGAETLVVVASLDAFSPPTLSDIAFLLGGDRHGLVAR